jgi:Flp pilus assembly pilin Flp
MSASQPEAKQTKGKTMNLKRLWKEDEGQDLIEYVMLAVLIALGAAATFPTLATAIDKGLSSTCTAFKQTC